jgi:DNA-binding NtrC family response regulator
MNDATQILGAGLPSRGGSVEVVAGASRGARLDIGRDPVTVGRHKSCNLVLDDGKISSIHCELQATHAGVRVRDVGSKNGTYVGAVRITEAFLTEPGVLIIGETELAFAPTTPETVPLVETESFGPLAGRSAVMRSVFERLARAAPTELTVLLLGETGTGKEVAAQAIHGASGRKGPFVVVDCAAIAPSLAESTLFGHERGAFTGAVQRRVSPFVEARGGTLFLDELGELPLELQPRLLRVLAERRVKAVGSSEYVDVDVRIVCATRQDLVRGVHDGSFRSDLYFRVAQLRVELPPLRERLDDLPLLVRRILADLGDESDVHRVPDEAWKRLLRHDYPGNVRELRNAVVVAHALSASAGAPIDIAAHLADARVAHEGPSLRVAGRTYHEAKEDALGRFEREYFGWLVGASGGRIGEMAALADLQRAHVRKYLRRHGLGTTRTRGSRAPADDRSERDRDGGDE